MKKQTKASEMNADKSAKEVTLAIGDNAVDSNIKNDNEEKIMKKATENKSQSVMEYVDKCFEKEALVKGTDAGESVANGDAPAVKERKRVSKKRRLKAKAENDAKNELVQKSIAAMHEVDAELLEKTHAIHEAECESTLVELNAEFERVDKVYDSTDIRRYNDTALVEKAVKHACALIAAEYNSPDEYYKIKGMEDVLAERKKARDEAKANYAEHNAEYKSIGDKLSKEDRKLKQETLKELKAVAKEASEAVHEQEEALELEKAAFDAFSHGVKYADYDELIVRCRFELAEDIALAEAQRELKELKDRKENRPRCKDINAARKRVEAFEHLEEADADGFTLDAAEQWLEYLESQKSQTPEDEEIKVAKEMVKIRKQELADAIPFADYIVYKIGVSNDKRPNAAMRVAFEVAERVNFLLGINEEEIVAIAKPNKAKLDSYYVKVEPRKKGDKAGVANLTKDVKSLKGKFEPAREFKIEGDVQYYERTSRPVVVENKVLFNMASERSYEGRKLPMLVVASRSAAKIVAKNAVTRQGTPTQWSILNAANRGDWEHHDIADMVSSAQSALSYINASDEMLEKGVDELYRLQNSYEKLKVIAQSDYIPRASVVAEYDLFLGIDSKVKIAQDNYNAVVAELNRLESLKADADARLRRNVEIATAKLHKGTEKLHAEVDRLNAELEDAKSAEAVERRKAIQSVINGKTKVAEIDKGLKAAIAELEVAKEKALAVAESNRDAEKAIIEGLIKEAVADAEEKGITDCDVAKLCEQVSGLESVAVKMVGDDFKFWSMDIRTEMENAGVDAEIAVHIQSSMNMVYLDRENAVYTDYIDGMKKLDILKADNKSANDRIAVLNAQLADLGNAELNLNVDSDVRRLSREVERLETLRRKTVNAEIVNATYAVMKYEQNADAMSKVRPKEEYDAFWGSITAPKDLPELDAAKKHSAKIEHHLKVAREAVLDAEKKNKGKIRKDGEVQKSRLEVRKLNDLLKVARKNAEAEYAEYQRAKSDFGELGASRITNDHFRLKSRIDVLELALNAAFAYRNAETLLEQADAADMATNAAYRAINLYLTEERAIRVDYANTPMSIDDELNNTVADPRDVIDACSSIYTVKMKKHIRQIREAVYRDLPENLRKTLEALIKTGGVERRAADYLNRSVSTICDHRVEIAKLFAANAQELVPDSLERRMFDRVLAGVEMSAEIAKLQLESAAKKKAAERRKNMTSAQVEIAVKETQEKLAKDRSKIAQELKEAEERALARAAKINGAQIVKFENEASELEDAVNELVPFMEARNAAFKAYASLKPRMRQYMESFVIVKSISKVAELYSQDRGNVNRLLKNAAFKICDAVSDEVPEFEGVMVKLAKNKDFDAMLNFSKEIFEQVNAEIEK